MQAVYAGAVCQPELELFGHLADAITIPIAADTLLLCLLQQAAPVYPAKYTL